MWFLENYINGIMSMLYMYVVWLTLFSVLSTHTLDTCT